MKTLTVFTPSYNRAYILHVLYESLCRQTSQDFVWLIIDDGSTDHTAQQVAAWQAEARIEIQYHYKENHGMHSGHNAAYERIETELNTCIDSDDFMPDDAVHNIIASWRAHGNEKLAGIIGLDAYHDGKIVGSRIPEHLQTATLNGLYRDHGVTGDKKVVLRTNVVRQYPPYPLYPNEKLVPLGTLYKMIDQDWTYLCRNQVYCVVEYLEDGSSRNILKQYRKSPNGFFHARLVELHYAKSVREIATRAVHLTSSAIFARRNPFVGNPQKLITFFVLPLGLLLNGYLRYKTRNT